MNRYKTYAEVGEALRKAGQELLDECAKVLQLEKIYNFIQDTRGRIFKPVIMIIPENTNDVFIDIEQFIAWKKESPVNEAYCSDGTLVLGTHVFVFDVNACEFLRRSER